MVTILITMTSVGLSITQYLNAKTAYRKKKTAPKKKKNAKHLRLTNGEEAMQPKLKKKWLKALRSGEYRQTTRKLKSRNGAFCCLGVLCDIQGAKWDWSSGEYSTLGMTGRPPTKYRGGHTDFQELIYLNDGAFANKKHSFSEIADYIEKNL